MTDWQPIVLSAKLASLTTLILLLLATPLAWWLSRTQSRFKHVITSIVSLPLVLPPTVLGFYLLVSMAPGGILNDAFTPFGITPLAFSFTGLVIASVIYSLPFAVQPLLNAFEHLDNKLLEAAATLRASPRDRFCSIVLPLARPAYLSAGILTFAHTVGEFGVILMIGGNIPGETRVLSIAIYDHVEALEYSQAHWLSGGMILFSFVVLYALYRLNDRATTKQSSWAS